MPDLHARELAARMDGLPLALATAGAYLRQSPISFADYLQNYRTKWNVLQSVARDLPEYRDRTLYTTWDLSFNQVKRQDPSAANLFRILAYFDNEEVWYELLAAGQDPARPSWFNYLISDRLIFESAMRTLVNFCLVEVHAATGSYGLHTCVHDWMTDALNRPVDPNQYIVAFDCIVNLVNTVDLDSIASLQDRRRLAAHATRLGQDPFRNLLAGGLWANKYSDIKDVANLLSIQNKFEPAERFFIQALARYEEALKPDHPDTLAVVQNLGSLYYRRGKLDEAERMWTRALAGYEKALEPGHPNTLGVVQNLGLLYYSRGKLDEAERMWTRALAGYEKALEPDHSDTLIVVQNLGSLYHGRGKLDEAERMWIRAPGA
jgi:tetratricopeptide (TPR) repeat protein